MFRSLRAFARTPLIPVQPPYAIVPMATFRTYAPSEEPQDPSKPKPEEKVSSKNEAGRAGAPSTDEIAHSDAAYGGAGANPQESAEKIEKETTGPGSMKSTAANPKASKPPKETSKEASN